MLFIVSYVALQLFPMPFSLDYVTRIVLRLTIQHSAVHTDVFFPCRTPSKQLHSFQQPSHDPLSYLIYSSLSPFFSVSPQTSQSTFLALFRIVTFLFICVTIHYLSFHISLPYPSCCIFLCAFHVTNSHRKYFPSILPEHNAHINMVCISIKNYGLSGQIQYVQNDTISLNSKNINHSIEWSFLLVGKIFCFILIMFVFFNFHTMLYSIYNFFKKVNFIFKCVIFLD